MRHSQRILRPKRGRAGADLASHASSHGIMAAAAESGPEHAGQDAGGDEEAAKKQVLQSIA
jgi:hypothetical protein